MNGEMPALACPPWCAVSHGGELSSTSHQAHRYEGGQVAQVPYATLYLTDNGADTPVLAYLNGRLFLHVTARVSDSADEAIVIDLNQENQRGQRQARDLAGLLGALGHPGLAAAIGELLELAAAAATSRRDEAVAALEGYQGLSEIMPGVLDEIEQAVRWPGTGG